MRGDGALYIDVSFEFVFKGVFRSTALSTLKVQMVCITSWTVTTTFSRTDGDRSKRKAGHNEKQRNSAHDDKTHGMATDHNAKRNARRQNRNARRRYRNARRRNRTQGKRNIRLQNAIQTSIENHMNSNHMARRLHLWKCLLSAHIRAAETRCIPWQINSQETTENVYRIP